jgi:hypothetical protein
MGTWGPGNFDDDIARDFLADEIGRLESMIERILAGDIPEDTELDNVLDAGEHYLLPAVEMICVLHEGLGSDHLPRPEVVMRWASEYARQVSPMMKELDPVGYEKWYTTERRPVIEATFARLLRLSRALYKPNDG